MAEPGLDVTTKWRKGIGGEIEALQHQWSELFHQGHFWTDCSREAGAEQNYFHRRNSMEAPLNRSSARRSADLVIGPAVSR
ncbi:hypothetical protein GCM10023063_41300 [Arthrobacter methylotrophus]